MCACACKDGGRENCRRGAGRAEEDDEEREEKKLRLGCLKYHTIIILFQYSHTYRNSKSQKVTQTKRDKEKERKYIKRKGKNEIKQKKREIQEGERGARKRERRMKSELRPTFLHILHPTLSPLVSRAYIYPLEAVSYEKRKEAIERCHPCVLNQEPVS